MTAELSIVIPIFNERDDLRILDAEIHQALAGYPRSYEVLYVDDGSTDGSLAALRQLASERPEVRVLRLRRNSGQSAALVVGFRAARGDLLVTLDADLQNDPADIPKLLAAVEGCDLVSGIRARRRDSWVRRQSSRIANWVRRKVVGDSITDVGCSLKVYRAAWLRDLPAFNGLHRFLPGWLESRGARVREIVVSHRPRVHGESKYNIRGRLWRGVADMAGVRWLRRRWVETDCFEEIHRTWSAQPSSSAPDPLDRDASSHAKSVA